MAWSTKSESTRKGRSSTSPDRAIGPGLGLAILVACAIAEASAQAGRPERHATQPAASLWVVREKDAVVLELGPIVLPANAGHDGVRQPPPLTVALPSSVDGWFSGYGVDLVDEGGRPVPQVALHHVNVIAPAKRELFSDIMLRIAAAGAETGPVSTPSFLGLRVRPGDSLLVSAMLHNPTPHAYSATLRVRFPFKPADSRIAAISMYPFYLDVMPPAGSHSFDLPAGHSERYWEGRPAISGRIIGMGGHMHKYGTLLRLEDRSARKVMWEARPVVDSAREIVGMPPTLFLWRLGLPVFADHLYRLTVVYDNPTGAPIVDGGMGALGGAIVPARGTEWPSIDRSSPVYRMDYRLAYRLDGMQMSGPMHGMLP